MKRLNISLIAMRGGPWCKGQKFFLGWDCSRSSMVYDWQLDFTISFIFQQYFASLSRSDKKRLPLWEWRGSNVQEKSFVGSLQCTLLAFKHDLWEGGKGESLLQMQGIAGQQFVMISTELTENKGTWQMINFVCAKQLTPRIKMCWLLNPRWAPQVKLGKNRHP